MGERGKRGEGGGGGQGRLQIMRITLASKAANCMA